MTKKSPSFEENMQRLEQIVRAMELGDIPLEKSLELFMEGTKLVEQCDKLLNEVELQVTKITAGADGSPIEEEFPNE